MTVLVASENATLLDYAVSTDPNPVQASSLDGASSVAAITVVVSNGTSDVLYCNEISIALSLGDAADNLTNQGDAIQYTAPNGWKLDDAKSKDGTLVFVPVGSNRIAEDGLAFHFYNIVVNTAVGVTVLNIGELSSSDGANFQQRGTSYQIAKFPYSFFVRNFTTGTPQVSNGQSVTLTWVGSDNAVYSILYQDQSIDVTNVRTWQSPPLTRDTTFLLRVKVNVQGELVETQLSTSVNVLNPDIQATTLTVLQSATIGSPSAPGTLTVTGTQVVEGYLFVKGKASLNGGTVVEATATINALDVQNGLTVYGSALFVQDVTVNGTGTLAAGHVLGDLIVDGNIVHTSGALDALVLGASPAYISGSGTLQGGKARVDFSAAQNSIFASLVSFRVFLTPVGSCGGLCVTAKDAKGFSVEEVANGTSDAAFDWMVVAG